MKITVWTVLCGDRDYCNLATGCLDDIEDGNYVFFCKEELEKYLENKTDGLSEIYDGRPDTEQWCFWVEAVELEITDKDILVSFKEKF